jgi:hypothetical protein
MIQLLSVSRTDVSHSLAFTVLFLHTMMLHANAGRHESTFPSTDNGPPFHTRDWHMEQMFLDVLSGVELGPALTPDPAISHSETDDLVLASLVEEINALVPIDMIYQSMAPGHLEAVRWLSTYLTRNTYFLLFFTNN